MKSKFLGLFLLMASPVVAGGFFIGFGGGNHYNRGGYGYYSRPPIVTYAPPVYGGYGYAPGYAYGPEYSYGSGYGYSNGYGRPPFRGGIWVAPRFYRGHRYNGYWRR